MNLDYALHEMRGIGWITIRKAVRSYRIWQVMNGYARKSLDIFSRVCSLNKPKAVSEAFSSRKTFIKTKQEAMLEQGSRFLRFMTKHILSC